MVPVKKNNFQNQLTFRERINRPYYKSPCLVMSPKTFSASDVIILVAGCSSKPVCCEHEIDADSQLMNIIVPIFS